MSSFHKVEISLYANKGTKTANDAHANWLNYSVQHRRMAGFRIVISHCKEFVTMNDEEAFKYFLDTWKHYKRVIY
jgi:hypothetical protein